MNIKQIEIDQLHAGAHEIDEPEVCAVEYITQLRGEAKTDAPTYLSPVIAAFLRRWNDDLGDAGLASDVGRRLQVVCEQIATNPPPPDSVADERRAWMALDWLIRVQLVSWLRLANLSDHAAALAAQPEIIAWTTDIDGLLTAARAAAWAAARAAARAAASAAARDAARAAARAAARDAASAAARDAARDAARAAAWDAARDAARAAAWAADWAAGWAAAKGALEQTVTDLQRGAFVLLDRMIGLDIKSLTPESESSR